MKVNGWHFTEEDLVQLSTRTWTKIIYYTTKDCVAHSKSNYNSVLISSNKGNSKSLFSLLMQATQPPDCLPPHFQSDTCCNSLKSFFNDKVLKVHQQLGANPLPSTPPSCLSSTCICPFRLPAFNQISNLIHKSQVPTCFRPTLQHRNKPCIQ